MKAALDVAVNTYGGIDVAFNNAGIEQPGGATLADTTDDDWDRVIAANLRGVFLSRKHQIPLLLQRGGGAIVNTSSGAGIRGFAGAPPTGRRNSGSSAPPSAQPWSTRPKASGSTPSAPASSTPA